MTHHKEPTPPPIRRKPAPPPSPTEKRYDGAKILSDMTGGAISKPQILAMWEEIKENDRKLTECLGPHDFQSTVDKRVFECAKCGGTIRISEKNWYEKGLEHGKA